MKGTLIRLFLVDGSANGIKTIEVSNMTVYATTFPRSSMKNYSQRDSANKPGVYILIGSDIENPDEKMVYIGEGDPVLPRLKSHFSKKDFWTDAIVFTSKDNYLTKTQIQYIESTLITDTIVAKKVLLDNTQVPNKPNISEVEAAEVESFLDGINLILNTIGEDFSVPTSEIEVNENENSSIYELTNKEAKGLMRIVEDKYIVLKGSTAIKENRASSNINIVKLRNKLIKSNVLVLNNQGLYEFQEDYSFNSPSYAGAVIVGGNVNGQKRWNIDGVSLKELENQELI